MSDWGDWGAPTNNETSPSPVAPAFSDWGKDPMEGFDDNQWGFPSAGPSATPAAQVEPIQDTSNAFPKQNSNLDFGDFGAFDAASQSEFPSHTALPVEQNSILSSANLNSSISSESSFSAFTTPSQYRDSIDSSGLPTPSANHRTVSSANDWEQGSFATPISNLQLSDHGSVSKPSDHDAFGDWPRSDQYQENVAGDSPATQKTHEFSDSWNTTQAHGTFSSQSDHPSNIEDWGSQSNGDLSAGMAKPAQDNPLSNDWPVSTFGAMETKEDSWKSSFVPDDNNSRDLQSLGSAGSNTLETQHSGLDSSIKITRSLAQDNNVIGDSNETQNNNNNNNSNSFSEFDEFSSPSNNKSNEQNSDKNSDFGNFGGFEVTTNVNIKQEKKNNFDDFGDFETNTTPSATKEADLWGADQFESKPTQNTEIEGFGEGFGDFAASTTTSNNTEDDFGSFGSFQANDNPAAPIESWGSFKEPAVSLAKPASIQGAVASTQSILNMSESQANSFIVGTFDTAFKSKSISLNPNGASSISKASLTNLLTRKHPGGNYWGPQTCTQCSGLVRSGANCCMICGEVFVQRTRQDQWIDGSVAKSRFVRSMHIPELREKRPKILPSTPGSVSDLSQILATPTPGVLTPSHSNPAILNTTASSSDASLKKVRDSNSNSSSNMLEQSFAQNVLSPSPAVAPPKQNGSTPALQQLSNSFGSTPRLLSVSDDPAEEDKSKTTESPANLLDLDFFTSIASPSSATVPLERDKANQSDFDGFLLDFDIASSPMPPPTTAVPLNLNAPGAGLAVLEKLAQTNKDGSSSGTSSNSTQASGSAVTVTPSPADEKRKLNGVDSFTDLLRRIPDLSFMKSKTLSIPASKYKLDLKA